MALGGVRPAGRGGEAVAKQATRVDRHRRRAGILGQRSRLRAALVASIGGLALLTAVLTVAPQASRSANPPVANEQGSLSRASSLASAPGALAGGFTPAEFKEPDPRYKPATRWWWQGPLDSAEAVREIGAIAEAGFGEVEIAFSASAWASEEQRAVLGQVLDEADRLGVKVSMTMGAAWPVRTPNTRAGSGFASQELQYGRVDLAGGDAFDGPVPDPIDAAQRTQPRELVAVTAARVVEAGPPVTTPGQGQAPSKSTVLDESSLIDLTDRVQNGRITWRAPDTGEWVLFAFWSRENSGNYTNPFDADATRKATEDLDEIQIGDANAPKLQKAGADLFEDSLELHATTIFWTPKMEQEFAARRGYDMAKLLPMMFVQGMSDFPMPPTEPNPDFILPDGQGDKIRDDYYATLTDLYVDDHMTVLQDWAEKYGMRYKAQAAFLQNLEPIRSFRELIGMGGRGETESLNAGENLPIAIEEPAWRNSLEFQRTVASGVHQAGGTELSVELGAIFKAPYTMNLDDYKELLSKEWSAGVSHPFIHGFVFQSAGAAWPGRTRFGTVTENWNDRNFPQWSSWPKLTGFFARGTRVLETGSAKTDVAVYSDAFLSPRGNESPFDGASLERAGYSIGYVDPEGLAEDAAPSRGELFPDTVGYRALVIDQRAISHQAAAAVRKAAEAGVRVVFVGDLPRSDTTYATGGEGDKAVQRDVAATLKSRSATHVDFQGDVATALAELRLSPRVDSGGTQLLTQWRQVDGGAYIYLYNPADDQVSVAPSFDVDGVPSELDLWDGSVSPVAQYSSAKGRTTVPMTLDSHEVKVVAVDSNAAPSVHVVDPVAPTDGELITDGDRILLRTSESGQRSFRLSNGPTRTVGASVGPGSHQPPTTGNRPSLLDRFGPWTLSVQTVTPTGGSTVEVPGHLGESQFQQYRLKDWRDFPAVTGESGVGTYTASTVLDEGWRADEDDGMWLNLGRVDGTATISFNGELVGTQVDNERRWDVTDHLRTGTNTIEVKVRTTLRNAVTKYNQNSTVTQPYGLRGPVRLDPYDGVVVYDPQR
jgi:hypothetical protein